jgi:hypothetical protein
MRWTWLILGAIAAAVIGIAAWQAWETEQLKIARWMDTDRPDCQAWDAYPQRNETVTWTGDCRAGKAEGQGVLTWRYTDPAGNPLTETHTGGLSAGKLSGQGTAIMPGGHRFDGMYRDGEENGHGVMVWSDARFEGEWKDGKPHGFGTFTTSDGAQHAGKWIQGCLEDAGEIYWIENDTETCEKLLKK